MWWLKRVGREKWWLLKRVRWVEKIRVYHLIISCQRFQLRFSVKGPPLVVCSGRVGIFWGLGNWSSSLHKIFKDLKAKNRLTQCGFLAFVIGAGGKQKKPMRPPSNSRVSGQEKNNSRGHYCWWAPLSSSWSSSIVSWLKKVSWYWIVLGRSSSLLDGKSGLMARLCIPLQPMHLDGGFHNASISWSATDKKKYFEIYTTLQLFSWKLEKLRNEIGKKKGKELPCIIRFCLVKW